MELKCRAWHRLAGLIVATIAIVVLTPGVASAHAVGSIKATDYKSALDSFNSPAPGIRMKVAELGNKVEVTNPTATELMILGYSGEPYLRVSKNGVFTNENSPAYYSNQTATPSITASVPTETLGSPDWHKTSSGDTAIWHDHRVHWVAGIDPPIVKTQPHVSHVVIPVWTIEMQYDNRPVVATGHLAWVPPPTPIPYYGIALLAFLIGAAASLVKRNNVAVAIGLAVLVAVDITHTVGQLGEFVGSAGSIFGRAGPNVLPSVVAWIVGVFGATRLLRRADDGPWFSLFTACVIGLLGGLSDFDSLNRSQLAVALNPTLGRALVAISGGLGLGLVVASVVMLKRQHATRPPIEPEPMPEISS